MSDTRTIYQAIEEAILEYTDGTGRIYSEQEEGLWNIADRTAATLTRAPQAIRTVEELQALDPDTVVERRGTVFRTASEAINVAEHWGIDAVLPAVVIREGAEVRAAREALEEA